MHFGSLSSTAIKVGAGLREIAIAGKQRPQLLSLLHPAAVVDTMIEAPDCGMLFDMGLVAWEQTTTAMPQVSPLTEESEIFYEST
uniref:Uncharacterized protein n=1 Tax=Candidatus Kentrum sp. TUN TaxID=2126343 RepID=A0A451A8A4_9GAMM|nr:MAG: hypothetical protein BECKTUN1418F_GA0071002_10803 [Candidatus Kentron sp. TUN]VFK62262.1 MAG: hypothetical protein BECKTUN1418E_GA0071001_10773 [Candidatus Kentron sp. TUN]